MSASGEYVVGADIKYPEARRDDTTDIYHGIEVPDPYRWLEADSVERDAWMAEQARLIEVYGPSTELANEIKEHIKGYLKPVIDSVEARCGDRRFFDRTTIGDDYDVLIERLSDGRERQILDPNTWSEDGSIALNGEALSPEGNFLAFSYSVNDNDRENWRIMDTNTGEVLTDDIPETIHSSIVWLNNETGFYYDRTDGDQRSVYFHKIHTGSEADMPIFIPDVGDETLYGVDISDDQQWLYISGRPLVGSAFYDVLDLNNPNAPAVRLIDTDAEGIKTYPVYNQGTEHILSTTKDAPKGKLVTVNLGESEWIELIPESTDVLQSSTVVCDRLVCEYYDGLRQYVKIFDLKGQELFVIAPPEGIGVVTAERYDYDDPEVMITIEGPVSPLTTYSYDVITGVMKKIKDPDSLIDTSNMMTEVRYATSADGTRVPMFVSYLKDIELNGDNPTILYGYGGYGESELPEFYTSRAAWIQMGGVYAAACLRGGGEFGQEWHEAAKGLKKKRTFEDFIACAESLISDGFSCSKKLAINGGSNGGLLVAACMLQRPDLFGAVIPECGALDMLRIDKGDNHSIFSKFWANEDGSIDNKDEFENIYSYSPVHNVAPADYPPLYAMHSVHDDRVPIWHSYKFVAALQAAQLGNRPTLIDIDHNGGHSVSSLEKYLSEIARKYAFLVEQFNMRLDN